MSTFLNNGLGFAAYMLRQAAQDALLRNEIGSAEDSTIGRPIGISTCKISSTLSFVVWAGSIARATYDPSAPDNHRRPVYFQRGDRQRGNDGQQTNDNNHRSALACSTWTSKTCASAVLIGALARGVNFVFTLKRSAAPMSQKPSLPKKNVHVLNLPSSLSSWRSGGNMKGERLHQWPGRMPSQQSSEKHCELPLRVNVLYSDQPQQETRSFCNVAGKRKQFDTLSRLRGCRPGILLVARSLLAGAVNLS